MPSFVPPLMGTQPPVGVAAAASGAWPVPGATPLWGGVSTSSLPPPAAPAAPAAATSPPPTARRGRHDAYDGGPMHHEELLGAPPAAGTSASPGVSYDDFVRRSREVLQATTTAAAAPAPATTAATAGANTSDAAAAASPRRQPRQGSASPSRSAAPRRVASTVVDDLRRYKELAVQREAEREAKRAAQAAARMSALRQAAQSRAEEQARRSDSASTVQGWIRRRRAWSRLHKLARLPKAIGAAARGWQARRASRGAGGGADDGGGSGRAARSRSRRRHKHRHSRKHSHRHGHRPGDGDDHGERGEHHHRHKHGHKRKHKRKKHKHQRRREERNEDGEAQPGGAATDGNGDADAGPTTPVQQQQQPQSPAQQQDEPAAQTLRLVRLPAAEAHRAQAWLRDTEGRMYPVAYVQSPSAPASSGAASSGAAATPLASASTPQPTYATPSAVSTPLSLRGAVTGPGQPPVYKTSPVFLVRGTPASLQPSPLSRMQQPTSASQAQYTPQAVYGDAVPTPPSTHGYDGVHAGADTVVERGAVDLSPGSASYSQGREAGRRRSSQATADTSPYAPMLPPAPVLPASVAARVLAAVYGHQTRHLFQGRRVKTMIQQVCWEDLGRRCMVVASGVALNATHANAGCGATDQGHTPGDRKGRDIQRQRRRPLRPPAACPSRRIRGRARRHDPSRGAGWLPRCALRTSAPGRARRPGA